MEFVLRIFFIFLVAILNFILHEFGHLISGLFVRYKFKMLGLVYLMWYKDQNTKKIKLRRIKPKVYNYTAFCDMTPCSDSLFPRIFYILGGGLVNLLVAVIFIICSIYFTQINFMPYIIVSLGVALYSFIPMMISALPNDGMQVLMLLKSKDAQRGLFMYDHIQQELSRGRRYRDLDAEIFSVLESSKVNELYNSMLVVFNAKRLYDMGEYDLSFECLNKLNINKLSYYIKNMVYIDLLYYFIVHKYDLDMAKKIYSDKQIMTYLASTAETQVNSARVLSAYSYFIEKNKGKGKIYLENAFKMLKYTCFTNDGLAIMEKDYCLKLDEVYKKD